MGKNWFSVTVIPHLTWFFTISDFNHYKKNLSSFWWLAKTELNWRDWMELWFFIAQISIVWYFFLFVCCFLLFLFLKRKCVFADSLYIGLLRHIINNALYALQLDTKTIFCLKHTLQQYNILRCSLNILRNSYEYLNVRPFNTIVKNWRTYMFFMTLKRVKDYLRYFFFPKICFFQYFQTIFT